MLSDKSNVIQEQTGSDHSLLAFWMKIRLKKLKKHKEAWKYDFNLVFSSKEVEDSYNVAVRNIFELLQEVDDMKIY